MIKDAKLEYGTVGAFHVDDIFNLEGQCDASDVHTFEGHVDTSESTLSYLGDQFPNLRKLRLNNSIIPSVRDLGCRFTNLRFLSLARCGITSLSGISIISNVLEELYLAFNFIDDCSDLVSMDSLIVLDLEENKISDMLNIEFLKTCSNLKSLTLAGNPCVDDPEKYRNRVQELLPNLRYLDEKRLKAKVPSMSNTANKSDVARVKNEITYKSQSPTRNVKSNSPNQNEIPVRPPAPPHRKIVKIKAPETENNEGGAFEVKPPTERPKARPPSSMANVRVKANEPEYENDDEVIITEMLDDLIDDRPTTAQGNYESQFFRDNFELPVRNKTPKGFVNKPHVVTPKVQRGKNRPVSAAKL